jgi:hypothetical protein
MTTAYLDSQNRLHRESASSECPHCGATAHLSLLACPPFARVRADRPARVGVVLQCDSCHTPVFWRYRVRAWHDDRVEFHPQPEEVERSPERFSYAHLPEKVAGAFREALACYSAGLLQAFAAMCRTTTQAMLEDLGERSRVKIFDQVAEVRVMADIDEGTFGAIRRVLFEGEPSRGAPLPPLNRLQAAVLVETMKDLLYQTYVRRAKLQTALRLRHFPTDATVPSPSQVVAK